MHQVIIINMESNFTVSDIYSKNPEIKEITDTIRINGKQEAPFMLGSRGHTGMYAIGLKLGMLPYFADLPAIETNDLAVGAGGKKLVGPVTLPDNKQFAWFSDPEGNILGLITK